MKVKVRRAKKSDREPLMSFIRNVWGGHDYVPHVWDEWVNDPHGEMFVIEANGIPVGMNRVRLLEDGSAWFEGVRVHPDYRGRGFASMLGENSMRVARRHGAKVFRLASSSRNSAAHRQVARIRFHEVARISVYTTPQSWKASHPSGVRKATREDLNIVKDRIERSREFALGRKAMWDGFTALELTPQVITKMVEDGAVYLAGGAVGIARPGREGKNVWSQVCFVGGEPDGALRITQHVFSEAENADWKVAIIPQGSSLIGAFRRAGYVRDFSLVLFERRAKG